MSHPSTAERFAHFLIILCLALISRSSAGQEVNLARSAQRVRQIIAHRGASKVRPECTVAALEAAIHAGATAVEVDVRTTKDGHLIIMHDATVDRTTDGTGRVSELTLAQIRKLDAGSWFDRKFAGQRVPTLAESLKRCRQRIDVLLDLKGKGKPYIHRVIEEVKKYGDPRRTIVGVRSLEQARTFRKLLPRTRQLALLPSPDDIEAFAKAGVDTIRLWPRWLKPQTNGQKLVRRVRNAGTGLHLNGTTGSLKELRPLLAHGPTSLSADDPARLVKSLKSLR